jgi:predicted phosphodiesterase
VERPKGMENDAQPLADRVAIIADPHANLRGMEICFKKIKSLGIEKVFCCGDVVGYGNEPNQIIDFFQSHRIESISGNHDRLVCSQGQRERWNPFALRQIDWTQSVLSDAGLRYLSSLPLNIVTGEFCIVHGAWSDPDKYLFGQNDFFEEIENLPARIVFFGHTHVPCVFQLMLYEDKMNYRHLAPSQLSEFNVKPEENSPYTLTSFINPGTAGYPRGLIDQGSFIVWEKETGKISYHFYDLP